MKPTISPELRERLAKIGRWLLPRIPWAIAGLLVLAGALASGIRARDVYHEYVAARGPAASVIDLQMTARESPFTPVFVEAFLSAIDSQSLRDAMNETDGKLAPRDRGVAAGLVRLQAADQAEAAESLTQAARTSTEETDAVGPSFGELLKLADARRATSDALDETASLLEFEPAGGAVEPFVVAARGARGTCDVGFERFAESWGNRPDPGRLAGGGGEAVRRVLRREALLALSRMGITGDRAQKAAGSVAGRLRSALDVKRAGGPVVWREQADFVVWEASRGLARGVGGRSGAVVNALLFTPGYSLERPEYDIILTFESPSDFSGVLHGEYTSLVGSNRVVVDGTLDGILAPDGQLAAEGSYEIVETGATGERNEAGTLSLNGLRSRTGFHQGSLTFISERGSADASRTLVWTEVVSADPRR